MPCYGNVSLAILDRVTQLGILLGRTKEGAVSADYFARLWVKAASVDAPVNALSGGNQQKIILVKWLARGGRLLIVDEPTRGVDVGTNVAIHGLIDDLARQGPRDHADFIRVARSAQSRDARHRPPGGQDRRGDSSCVGASGPRLAAYGKVSANAA